MRREWPLRIAVLTVLCLSFSISAEEPVPWRSQPLEEAAARGDVAALRRIIAEDPQALADDGPSALASAAIEGREDAVACLLQAGVDPDAAPFLVRPLHQAVREGHAGVADILLSHGADPNARTGLDDTPLLMAVRARRADLVKVLVSHGADVEARSTSRLGVGGEYVRLLAGSPLQWAAERGDAEITRILLDAGADVEAESPHGWRAIHKAADHYLETGDDAVLKVLRDYGSEPDIHAASMLDDVAAVRAMLEDDPALLNARKAGVCMTPLACAAQSGAAGVVKFLLDAGADVHIPNCYGNSPVHLAADEEQDACVDLLVEHGADLNEAGYQGNRPLHCAARDGKHLMLMSLLFDLAADVNVMNDRGQTPLYLAARRGDQLAVALILEEGGDPSIRASDGRRPIDILVAQARRPGRGGLHLLLEDTPDPFAPDGTGKTIVESAADRTDRESIDMLVEAGADVCAEGPQGWTPLLRAAWEGQEDMVADLREMGAAYTVHAAVVLDDFQTVARMLREDPDSVHARGPEGQTPLHWCREDRHGPLARLLLSTGADPNAAGSNGQTPLHCAAGQSAWRASRLTELLLANGADVTVADSAGRTPLHLALASPAIGPVGILVGHGADVNARDNLLLRPVHLAVQNDFFGAGPFLLERGADATARAVDGWRPLHIAAATGSSDAVQALIDCGADVSARLHPAPVAVPDCLHALDRLDPARIGRSTPLHLAATGGWYKCVDVLLRNGADPESRDQERRTAMDIAVAGKHALVMQVLREHAAGSPAGD